MSQVLDITLSLAPTLRKVKDEVERSDNLEYRYGLGWPDWEKVAEITRKDAAVKPVRSFHTIV